MLSGNQVKYINSLKQKKYREIHRQFIAEGSKLVTELAASAYHISAVYATPEWISGHPGFARECKIIPNEVSASDLGRITALSSPAPVLAVVDIPESTPPTLRGLILMLDDIRDPGNLGTIIRIADWFGIGQVICSETTVDLYNPKVIQSTMGSISRVSVTYAGLVDFLSGIPAGTSVYGTFLSGDNIYSSPLEQEGIIIIGNEAEGISIAVEKFITNRLFIPSFPGHGIRSGSAESLNASIATAIVCSEFRRRTIK
jgi:RNA methyltransferase, TrmH family